MPPATTPVARRPGVQRAWPLALATLALLAGTAVGVRAVVQQTGGPFVYALDDAYIHMAMGRSLADAGVWGCTPYRFASASSSPLWTVVLAIADVVTGTHEATPLVLNVVCCLLLLWTADRWLARRGAAALVRAVTLVGLVVTFPMAAMALFGMEHALHALLTVVFATAAVDALAPPSGRSDATNDTLKLALLAALLGASRYEGYFLVALVCLALACAGRWREGLTIGVVATVPVVALGLASVLHGSLFLPTSLMLKAGGESASTTTALFRLPGWVDMAALRQSRGLLALAVGGSLVAALQWVRTRRWRDASVLLPGLLVWAIALHVHFAFSSTFWVYRYDAYLLVLGVFVAGTVATAVTPPGAEWRRALLPAVAVAASLFLVGDPRHGLLPRQEVASASLTHREHYQAAQFVRAYYPGRAVVVNDVGAMAYFSDANVLDMFGLCDIEPVLERRAAGGYDARDVQRWTEPLHPRIAVVQLSWGWVLPHLPSTWRRVAVVELVPDQRTLGFYAIDPAVSGVELRADIEEFYRPLTAPLGYRIQYF